MKCKTIFGALLVSVALCSQGFGFELLNGLLGLNGGGCGECKACAKVACCEKAAPKACCPEPACCAKACPKPCAKVACEPTCGKEKKVHCTPVRDLFDNIKDLFGPKGYVCDEPKACCPAKGCCPEPCAKACPKACEKVSCEPTCGKSGKIRKCLKACAPAACAKACGPAACEKACAPATCEKVAQPKCHKLYRRPVLELLEDLFGSCKKHGEGCEAGCCEAACGGTAPAKAPATTAPAKAPEKAAPLPQAPKADPSASIQSRGIYQASRSLVRN